eukprot:8838787-Pyramimonas_sp.AAC.1
MYVLPKYMKEHPLALLSRALSLPGKLIAVGDAAFRREPDGKGLAMRGAVYLLAEDGEGPGGRCNVLEFYSRKQAHV